MPGSERVLTANGLGVLDLRKRELVSHTVLPEFGSEDSPSSSLLIDRSGRMIFLCSYGLVRALSARSREFEFEWTLPKNALPMAVIDDGNRAILGFETMSWRKLALVSRS